MPIINILEKNRARWDTYSTGVGQIHSPGTMQNLSTMIKWQENLGRIGESEKVSFQMVMERNYAI